MTGTFAESTIEEAALSWFTEVGYEVRFGPDIEPEKPNVVKQISTYLILLKENHREEKKSMP